jgi:hypothetical protein
VTVSHFDFSSPNSFVFATVSISFTVALLNLNPTNAIRGIITLSIPELRLFTELSVTLAPTTEWVDRTSDEIQIAQVKLWWPHTLGESYLYDASVSFTAVGMCDNLSNRWKYEIKDILLNFDKVKLSTSNLFCYLVDCK